MPTIMRIDGMRVMIYTRDHPPAHVHVRSDDGEGQFWLHCPNGPPTVREIYNLSNAQVRRALAGIEQAVAALCKDWSEIHGDF